MPDQETLKRLADLENDIKALKEKNNAFEHEFNGVVRIKGGELIVGGGQPVEGITGGTKLPIVVLDDPGVDSSKRASGFGVSSLDKDEVGEQITAAVTSQKLDIKKTAPSTGSENQEGTKAQDVNLAELLIQHFPNDITTFNSFLTAIRNPMLFGTGRIDNGGSTLTDLSLDLKTDELAGAFLFITGSPNECFEILSNTATVITVDGAWVNESDEYEYQISRPVYLGSANAPWRRLYIQNDIRFGKGATDPAYPSTGYQTFRAIMESSKALSFESAIGSKKQATTVGAGFTLTWASSYHILTGTAARTSDGTTAITDGDFVGQLLILEGTHDVNTITIQDGANTQLAGGADAVLGAGDTLFLVWNGTVWVEISRSDN